jgi:predicted DNA-binding protein (MmcQ/YjbR family)
MAAVSAETCVRHLRAACVELPEAKEYPGGEDGRHVACKVRGRTFGYFTNEHHGDGRLALTTKAPPGEQAVLVAAQPERFFVPPSLGHRGWVGLGLDGATPEWNEVRELLVESYCLCALRSLAAKVSG